MYNASPSKVCSLTLKEKKQIKNSKRKKKHFLHSLTAQPAYFALQIYLTMAGKKPYLVKLNSYKVHSKSGSEPKTQKRNDEIRRGKLMKRVC